MVKDRSFYDLLGVEPNATKDQIRKGYYRRAKACHPDKHPDDKAKEAEFKAVSEAYQVLSDDKSRAAYDQFGRESMEGGQYADAKDIFATVFGSAEFEPFFGTLTMCTTVDEDLQKELDEVENTIHLRAQELAELHAALRAEGQTLPPEELEGAQRQIAELREQAREKQGKLDEAARKIQQERVDACAQRLRQRVEEFSRADDAGREAWRKRVAEEFERLKVEHMGEPMLHTIGYVYTYTTLKVLGKHGVGIHRLQGHVEDAREGLHKFSEVVGAIGSGARLLRAHYKLSVDAQAEDEKGKLSEADREWYQQNMAKRMFHIAWTFTKKDIEDTLREVVESVVLQPGDSQPSSASSAVATPATRHQVTERVGDTDISYAYTLPAEALARAEAIQEIGDAFLKAMSFEQFLNKDDPPSTIQRATSSVEDSLRQRGIDVDGAKRAASEQAERAALAAQETVRSVGTAFNKMFNLGKPVSSR